jgi:hypothetical protein
MRTPPLTKLAGLGALAAAGGILAIYALLVFITIPRPRTAGIDMTNGVLTWISVGLVILALVIPHVVFGRILLSEAKTGRDVVP